MTEQNGSVRGAWRAAWESAWRDRTMRVVLLATLLLGLIYNFVILIGFGPDEPRHMKFVELLLEERRLPLLIAPGQEYRGAHTLHPPLYYTLLVPFYASLRGLPNDLEWHMLRLVSLASVPLWFDIARRAGGEVTPARLLCASLALLPIFGMTSGVISNDSATLFFVTLARARLYYRAGDDDEVSGRRLSRAKRALSRICEARRHRQIAIKSGVVLLWYGSVASPAFH